MERHHVAISATADGTRNTSDDCVDDANCHPHHHHCPCRSTGHRCVRNCLGMPNGDYQSCRCCHGQDAYVSCSGGYIYYRPCPANLLWTDDLKICDYTSRTCRECAWVSIHRVNGRHSYSYLWSRHDTICMLYMAWCNVVLCEVNW